jgi:ribokinase
MTLRPVVISLGSINADFQMRVERRPEQGETLVGADFARLAGGKAANVAYQARMLGVPVRLFGRVGEDDLANQALSPLRNSDIDLSGVTSVSGCATGLAMITVPPDGKKGIVLAPNANAVWERQAARMVGEAVAKAPRGSVLVLDVEIPEPVAAAAAEAAAGCGLTCILDPSPADAVSERLLRLASVVLPNPTEARMLTGIAVEDVPSAGRAAVALGHKGPRATCVKLPEGGCVVWSDGRLHHIEGETVTPLDTTGAGDVFAGVLASFTIWGASLLDAARAAVAASGHAVQHYGSQAGCPNRDQIEARLDKVRATSIPLDA